MNFIKKPIILIAFVLFAIPMTGFAQYQFELKPFLSYFKDPGRYELGFNYGLLSVGQYQGVMKYGPGGDTTASRNIANTSIGGSIGLSLPFKATGHISCWAMSIHLMANMYTSETLNQTMGSDGTYKPSTPALTANTMQIALPIGVEWKVGTDAILSKRLATGATFGAGLMPQYNMTSMTASGISNAPTGSSIGIYPYAKVECAFFIGMCVKLRFMYTMGNIDYIDVNKPIAGFTDGPFRIMSNENLLFTAIIMPFSVGWKESAWWNTHDTYNQHDKLN